MIGNETHSHLTKYNRSEGPRGKRERAEMDDRTENGDVIGQLEGSEQR